MRLVLLPLGEIICTDLLDDVFNQVVIHLSKCFKFNFVYLSSISSPFLDKFGGGFCQPHLVSTSKSMLIQKFTYIVNLCGPETELALRFGVDTLVIGVPLVAVGSTLIVVLVVVLVTTVVWSLVGSLVDFN